jgi:TPR repeat protein
MRNREFRNALLGIGAALLASGALWGDAAAGMAAFKKGDYQAAFREWKAAADKGQPEAQYDLGLLYAKGLGVQRDLQVAQQWYEAAATQGNAQAEYSLGQMYAQGWGIPANQASTLRWMEMANGSNGDNQDDPGWLAIEGYGTATDFTKAAYWYRLAADQGHAEAQYDLARLYSDGKGVPRDHTQAFKLAQMSARRGKGRIASFLLVDGGGAAWGEIRREIAHRIGGQAAAGGCGRGRAEGCGLAAHQAGDGQKVGRAWDTVIDAQDALDRSIARFQPDYFGVLLR